MIGVFAHFAIGSPRIDGQIYRSRLLLSELKKRIGDDSVCAVDTGYIIRKPIRTLTKIGMVSRSCTDIIMMPNTRGLRWLTPIYFHWQRTKRIRVHFVVVGGWLPRFLRARPSYVNRLRQCAGIHVQTQRMLRELSELGLENANLLPNFRDFDPNRKISGNIRKPFRMVYLSRILPEKGPQLAIHAVNAINHEAKNICVTLDIWGPIQKGHENWFVSILKNTDPSFIRYHGPIDPNLITTELPKYDALIFPTFYSGEGFPGAVLDSMISGLAILASDWQDNAEFVETGRSGLLFNDRNLDDLKQKIRWMLEHPEEVLQMKHYTYGLANKYHVDAVIPDLLDKMGLGNAKPVIQ